MSSKDNKIRITWDGWSIEHIKKHNVNLSEVREVSRSKKVLRQSYLGRQIIYGITKKKRLLTIVLSFELQKEGYVISARDMNLKERKVYEYEKNKTNKVV